jgi:hypothetical protein
MRIAIAADRGGSSLLCLLNKSKNNFYCLENMLGLHDKIEMSLIKCPNSNLGLHDKTELSLLVYG